MRFNPRARTSGDAELRSGGLGLPGGGGPVTLGGLLVAGVVYLVAQFTGVDIGALGLDGSGSGPGTSQGVVCTGEEANEDPTGECAIALMTTSVQDYWADTFSEQVDGAYQPAGTVVFQGSTSSGCGSAQEAMGPFYCPRDQRVYLDVDFTSDMLEGQLGADGGPFALAYVIAHEYGHHVENLLGVLDGDRSGSGATSVSVKTELMADCLGGMWARSAQRTEDADGNRIIEELTQDDIDRAIDAARAVGDDRIQQRSGGRVNSESWTHGSAEQRAHWFNVGLKEGSLRACNTFAPGALG
jgi:hypothetical protein